MALSAAGLSAALALVALGLALLGGLAPQRLREAVYERAYARYMTDCWAPPPVPQAADESASGGLASRQEVHVVYSSTNTGSNYLGLLGSMLSLSRALQAPERCSIHLLVLEDELEDAQSLVDCFRRELTAMPTPHVQLHELHVSPRYGRMKHLPAMSLGVNSPHSLARFYLHEYLPQNVTRALWLDHDTLVRSDVEPLFRMQMKHALAAAYEPKWVSWGSYLRFLPQLSQELRREIRNTAAPVFNIGVLVYDLRRWRSEPLVTECERWFERVGRAVQVSPFLQLTFNFAFQGGVDVLDWRWNMVGMPPYHPPIWLDRVLRLDQPPETCVASAAVLHWAACPEKPWEGDSEYRSAYPACNALEM